jgi:hypothetical protein
VPIRLRPTEGPCGPSNPKRCVSGDGPTHDFDCTHLSASALASHRLKIDVTKLDRLDDLHNFTHEVLPNLKLTEQYLVLRVLALVLVLAGRVSPGSKVSAEVDVWSQTARCPSVPSAACCLLQLVSIRLLPITCNSVRYAWVSLNTHVWTNTRRCS